MGVEGRGSPDGLACVVHEDVDSLVWRLRKSFLEGPQGIRAKIPLEGDVPRISLRPSRRRQRRGRGPSGREGRGEGAPSTHRSLSPSRNGARRPGETGSCPPTWPRHEGVYAIQGVGGRRKLKEQFSVRSYPRGRDWAGMGVKV